MLFISHWTDIIIIHYSYVVFLLFFILIREYHFISFVSSLPLACSLSASVILKREFNSIGWIHDCNACMSTWFVLIFIWFDSLSFFCLSLPLPFSLDLSMCLGVCDRTIGIFSRTHNFYRKIACTLNIAHRFVNLRLSNSNSSWQLFHDFIFVAILCQSNNFRWLTICLSWRFDGFVVCDRQ